MGRASGDHLGAGDGVDDEDRADEGRAQQEGEPDLGPLDGDGAEEGQHERERQSGAAATLPAEQQVVQHHHGERDSR